MSIRSRLIGFALIAGAVLLIASAGQQPSHAAQHSAVLAGRVVGITDGDTLTLLDANNRQHTIRLAEIDTPERGQPYANKARQALSALVFQKQVSVRVVDVDKYDREVGRIYVGDTDVSAELIRQGAAWAYRDYLRDESLLAIEAEAKAAKRGIWGLSESQQVPPWEWRRLNRDQAKNAPKSPNAPNRACSIKGNISKNGRIYHVPGSTWYEQTRINTSKGERWFCSEEEARAAGWRPPHN